MIICIAVDEKNGMMFNNRRQSMDSELRKHLLEMSKGSKLWISTYTENQFEKPLSDNIMVDDDFLHKAEENDICFVENLSLAPHKEKICKIILFKWNRVYPADVFFEIDLLNEGWKLLSAEDFKGNSHDKITKEVWNK